MKPDITSRKDIEFIVNSFYDKVREDHTIGHYFTQVVHVNWENHLPKMYDFWESIVFHTGAYKGNPIDAHLHVHALSEFKHIHFERWLQLFKDTVESNFEGEHTEQILQRAQSIATVLEIKLYQSH